MALAKRPDWASTLINDVHGHGCYEFAGAAIKSTLRYDKRKTFRRFVVPATAITRVLIVIIQVVLVSSEISADLYLHWRP